MSRFDALTERDYRWFWLGSVVWGGGYQLFLLGTGWLVFRLSGSAMDLGYLGAAAAVPNMAVALFGGMLADRVDKRRLLIITSVLMAVLLALLAALDVAGRVTVGHVLAIVVVISAVTGLDWPARQSLFPSLIDRRHMMSAVALNSIVWQVSRMVLPALGGFIIALSDTWALFVLGAVGSLGMSWALVRIRPRRGAATPGLGFAQLVEGFRFVVRTPLFATLIPLTYCCMFFGTSLLQIMPLFAELLGSGETGYGLLISASGLGSIIGTFLVVPYQGSPRLGWIMLAGLGATAFSLQGFALVTGALATGPFGLGLALTATCAMGLFSTVYLISSMTVMQLNVPEQLRGRVMGLHGITYSLIPLGGLLAGFLAEVWSAPVAIGTNATLLLLAVICAAGAGPTLRQLDGAAMSER